MSKYCFRSDMACAYWPFPGAEKFVPCPKGTKFPLGPSGRSGPSLHREWSFPWGNLPQHQKLKFLGQHHQGGAQRLSGKLVQVHLKRENESIEHCVFELAPNGANDADGANDAAPDGADRADRSRVFVYTVTLIADKISDIYLSTSLDELQQAFPHLQNF